jgi:hypothetical protein
MNASLPLASEQDTMRLLQSLWYGFGVRLVNDLCRIYQATPEQREALEGLFLKPNDWIVTVKPPV